MRGSPHACRSTSDVECPGCGVVVWWPPPVGVGDLAGARVVVVAGEVGLPGGALGGVAAELGGRWPRALRGIRLRVGGGLGGAGGRWGCVRAGPRRSTASWTAWREIPVLVTRSVMVWARSCSTASKIRAATWPSSRKAGRRARALPLSQRRPGAVSAIVGGKREGVQVGVLAACFLQAVDPTGRGELVQQHGDGGVVQPGGHGQRPGTERDVAGAGLVSGFPQGSQKERAPYQRRPGRLPVRGSAMPRARCG